MKKTDIRTRRHRRIRARVVGTPARPRASVFRSNRGITVQLIDDQAGHTLVAAQGKLPATVGGEVAKAAKAANITQVVFDRSGYRYHGRVKAVADAMREGGLIF